MFRCRFLAIVDVRTIYRDHAKRASPVEWCLKRYNCTASWPCLACQVVFEKGRFALQAGHALPVKWCLNEKVELLCKLASPVKWYLKEKVLLGKWSAIAMLELQRIQFAGWALTKGQHRLACQVVFE